MKLAFLKWTKRTIMPSTENTKERNRHTVLLDYKMIKGGCCCLFFWLGGVHYHEKKELVKVKTFSEKWDSKALSVGTLLSHDLETKA
jgi:hypothetical protein